MRNKIIFILIIIGLISGTMILNKKIKKETVSVEKVDLRNYELKQMEGQIKVEYEKLLEKEREEEAKKKREEILRAEEEERLKEEQKIYCKFEVSFYTTAADEGSGTGIGASGEYVIPWVSIALPDDIPFYSEVEIEGLGNFEVHDRGSHIQWTYDEEGNLVCRADILVPDKQTAIELGRYYAEGYILLNN